MVPIYCIFIILGDLCRNDITLDKTKRYRMLNKTKKKLNSHTCTSIIKKICIAV